MKERFQTFTSLIAKISRNIKKIKNQEMAEYGLRSVHVTCLYYLYAAKSLTATELCELCEEDKATISRAIVWLEDNGYLICKSKSAKRYKSPLFLTEKGIEAAKKIATKIDGVLNIISESLPDEELVSFYRSLSIISEKLEKLTKISEI